MNEPKDVEVYLRVPPSEAPNGFKKVTNGSIFTKPTLLSCGGVRATHSYPDIANGYAKKAIELVNSMETNGRSGFQSASVTYADGDIDEDGVTLGSLVSSFNNGYGNLTLYKNFVDEQLRPLFIDESGQKRDIETVKKNFRNINVLTHSYGSFFMEQIGAILTEQMKEAGFQKPEIAAATRQILVVSVSSSVDFAASKTGFTKIHVVHLHDKLVAGKTDNIKVIKDAIARETSVKGERKRGDLVGFRFCHGDGKDKAIHADPKACEMVVATTNPAPPPEVLERYDPSHPEKKVHEFSDKKFHDCATYMYFSFEEYGLMLRSVLTSALANGINNSIANEKNVASFTPLPPLEELLKYPKKLDFNPTTPKAFLEFGKGMNYDGRIDDMLGHSAPVKLGRA